MTTADPERIGAEAHVSSVLSVQHDDCLAYWDIDYPDMRAHGETLGLRMARSPMRDFDIPDQRRHLARAVRALAGLQSEGHRTYVHCTAGLGRAPLTVLSYLVWVEGLLPEEAIGLIQRRRPGAVPAWETHHGCRHDLVVRYRPAIEERAYALSLTRAAGQGDPQEDWRQAEMEIIRTVLTTIGRREDAKGELRTMIRAAVLARTVEKALTPEGCRSPAARCRRSMPPRSPASTPSVPSRSWTGRSTAYCSRHA
jgi:hypothetical protein